MVQCTYIPRRDVGAGNASGGGAARQRVSKHSSYMDWCGRMGWFLLQTKGPRNAAIEPDQLTQIHNAFADADIPQSSIIDAIKGIVLTDKWSRHHQVPDNDGIFDDIALY